ncbi:hypothetical protein EC968_003529 [Mortierella alpina]|nr:hypothetical protein EC968_003529 [Mortierella alpina]
MKFGLGISAALALVFAGANMAAPTTPQGKTVRIPIANKGQKYQPNTIAEWSYTLRKFGFKHAAEGMTAQAVADLPLVDLGLDREYYGLVDIGTPAQTLKVMLDTGSARFLISSTECPDCTGSTHFDRKASSTYQSSDDEPWRAKFGDESSASGVTGRDIVKLADLTIENQPIHLAEWMSPDFDGFVDGILGLSFGVLSDTTSLLESMMDQNLLDMGVVSFALGNSASETGGEALFGGIDMSKVEEGQEITYSDVINDRYWAVKITDMFVKGQSVFPDSSSQSLQSVIDTGSTLVLVPSNVASAIHKKIPKAIRLHERWYVPCVGTEKLEFEIGGARFGVPYSDIVRERSALRGMCHSGVQTVPANFAIIGDQNTSRSGLAGLALCAKEHGGLFVGKNSSLRLSEGTMSILEAVDLSQSKFVFATMNKLLECFITSGVKFKYMPENFAEARRLMHVDRSELEMAARLFRHCISTSMSGNLSLEKNNWFTVRPMESGATASRSRRSTL